MSVSRRRRRCSLYSKCTFADADVEQREVGGAAVGQAALLEQQLLHLELVVLLRRYIAFQPII